MTFIETTRPPGYDVAEMALTETWTWQVGPDHLSNEYKTEAEACRAAWRHWTARVLRGREIKWFLVRGEIHCAHFGRVDIDERMCLDKPVFDIGVWDRYLDSFAEFERDTDDIDEAMARFAALVLAMEGMPA